MNQVEHLQSRHYRDGISGVAVVFAAINIKVADLTPTRDLNVLASHESFNFLDLPSFLKKDFIWVVVVSGECLSGERSGSYNVLSPIQTHIPLCSGWQ